MVQCRNYVAMRLLRDAHVVGVVFVAEFEHLGVLLFLGNVPDLVGVGYVDGSTVRGGVLESYSRGLHACVSGNFADYSFISVEGHIGLPGELFRADVCESNLHFRSPLCLVLPGRI